MNIDYSPLLSSQVDIMSARAWTLSIEDREKLIAAAFQGSVVFLSRKLANYILDSERGEL